MEKKWSKNPLTSERDRLLLAADGPNSKLFSTPGQSLRIQVFAHGAKLAQEGRGGEGRGKTKKKN